MRARREKSTVKKIPASVQLLATRLQSYDADVRRQAYQSLAKIDAPEEPLVEQIVEQFSNENWYVREAALKAIGHCVDCGCGELAARSIEPHLEHEDAHIRFCAGRALMHVEVQVQPILEKLKAKWGGADPRQIEAANAPAVFSTDALAARLQHEDPKIRQNALDALSRMGPYAVPHTCSMCELVTDPNVSVRNELMRVIERLGILLVDGVGILAAALEHEAGNMRRSGEKCLLQMSHACGLEVATEVAKLLKSENRLTRITALECLATLSHLAGPHGADMAELLQEEDAEVRMTAIRAIIAGGKPMGHHLKKFKKITENENRDISRAAVLTLRGLASVCPKVARSAFLELEEASELDARIHAVEILAGAGPNVRPYLEEVAKALEDKDWGLRRVAIECLCDLQEHGDAAAGEVARRLLHFDPDVRRAAAEALGRMGLHAGEYGHRVEGLMETEEDEDVKKTCVEACKNLYAAGMAHG